MWRATSYGLDIGYMCYLCVTRKKVYGGEEKGACAVAG